MLTQLNSIVRLSVGITWEQKKSASSLVVSLQRFFRLSPRRRHARVASSLISSANGDFHRVRSCHTIDLNFNSKFLIHDFTNTNLILPWCFLITAFSYYYDIGLWRRSKVSCKKELNKSHSHPSRFRRHSLRLPLSIQLCRLARRAESWEDGPFTWLLIRGSLGPR